uniref:Activin_recp domain-containing protein n=1 Tax=Panagrellus redivivus TaxID=6233 RepID=A0A7E4VUK1_PANRE
MRSFLYTCIAFSIIENIVNGEFECFVGDGSVYIPQPCTSNTTWCLKFVNSDNGDALRLCDNADEICPKFGDNCDHVKTPDIDSLPYSSLMCCCQGDRCNSASKYGLQFGLALALGSIYVLIY